MIHSLVSAKQANDSCMTWYDIVVKPRYEMNGFDCFGQPKQSEKKRYPPQQDILSDYLSSQA